MKLVMFDCDSTLVKSEGIDDLAELREKDREVARLTRMAMDGETTMSQIFTQRLDLIRPHRDDLQVISRRYLENIVEDAQETINLFKLLGYEIGIISGGYAQAVFALAATLGISANHIYAVDLNFDGSGGYLGFEDKYGLAKSGGKLNLLQSLRDEFSPQKLIMVGDSVTDLESKPAVDLFVGYGGVVQRDKVRDESTYYIECESLAPLLEIVLDEHEKQLVASQAQPLFQKIRSLKAAGLFYN